MLALVTAALLGLAFAAPNPGPIPHVLHERRDLTGAGESQWVRRSHVPRGRELPVRIGLAQNNLDIGDDLLMEVSNPASPKYGKYYTQDEIVELFAPSQDTVNSVKAWVEAAGIKNVKQSVNMQWLQFDTAIEDLEALLKTKYYEFVHKESGDVHVACDEYHVPEHLQEHIDYVTPGIKLARFKRIGEPKEVVNTKQKRSIDWSIGPILEPVPAEASSLATTNTPMDASDFTLCDIYIAPQCVAALYNVTAMSSAAASGAGNQLGIFEDIGQWWDQEDLNEFYKLTGLDIPAGFGPVQESIDGAPGPQPQTEAGLESLLDLSLSIPLIYPQQPVMFQVDDRPTELNFTYNGLYNNLFDAIDGSYCTYSAFGETGNSPIDPPYPDPQPGGYKHKLQCGKYTPTNVISISYGGPEDFVPVNYMRRQCNEIMKLGMQGVTVVYASGDSGVAYRTGAGDFCLGPDDNIFAPDYPANCPYVLAAGATYLPARADVFKDKEKAVSKTNPNAGGFNSGGGFSNVFPQASYQKDIVEAYLANNPPAFGSYETLYNQTNYNGSGFGADGGVYNRIGRAYPDVAAIGANVFDITYGAVIIVGGTSASAPTFSSILARINMELLAVGKPTVGFVHPVLYAHPEVFHDITDGNNRQCSTNEGFECAVGWDPVTGMGTPNYGKMLELFMSL